jgi:hypothetical protein
MGASMTTTWKEADAALRDLAGLAGGRKADATVKAALNFAVGKASPLAKMARALAPVRRDVGGIKRTYKGNVKTPGYLSRNLDSKPLKNRSPVSFTTLFGPKPEAFYGTQFLEKQIGKSGFRGPWLEPAFAATQEQTLKRFADRLAQNIEKARNKALSK